MLQDAKKGIVQRRKIQISDVHWRPNAIAVRQKGTEQAADSVKETMTEDEVMESVIDEMMVQEGRIAKDGEAFGVTKQKPLKKMKKYSRNTFGFKWIAMAFAMAVVVVIGIVYLVNKNMPDVALKVVAMQNGIDAVYPEYTPRGYTLSDITSEDGKVTLNFRNAEAGAGYTLVEERVDEAAKLSEYVSEAFGENYTRVDERGTVIYIGNGGAAWASGGVLFKLKITSGTLTRKQIVTIATTK